MSENVKFNESVATLLNGLDAFITTKTVVGEPLMLNDTFILPLMDVSMGIGAGAHSGANSKEGTAGGLGAKMSPSAVLIINSDGTTKLVSVKSQDAVTKLVDLLPDLIDRFTKRPLTKDPEVNEAVDRILNDDADDFAE